MTDLELEMTALAAGGDGLGRDEAGRVTFVPRTAPGDRARVRVVHATSSFARGELVELVRPSPVRVAPPCPAFFAPASPAAPPEGARSWRGCGGCAWQHVARAAQLEAKQAIVAGALRKLAGLVLHPVADPAPALGWRRRARFHVAGGRAGLYELGSQRVLPLDGCPQLEPALEGAFAAVAAASPPDGELALVLGHSGAIVPPQRSALLRAPAEPALAIAVGVEKPWRLAERLVGRAGIAGVVAGGAVHGEPVVEIDPGVWVGPWDFAQASAAGNAALVERVCAAVGPGPGRLLELHAGAGNLTHALAAAGWRVEPSDSAAPARPPPGFTLGAAADVIARATGPLDAAVLDPPRTGAPEAMVGLAALAPPVIVYVSCDPATLARDAARLVERGYRATDAWPIDLMPQTAHVEVVLRLVRS